MIQHVNPLIGTAGGGNCLPGPYLPLGLVMLGPDTLAPQPTHGYNADRPITGFSHTHVSGTGGAGRYGNIRLTPFIGPLRLEHDPSEFGNERAECGYYAVDLHRHGIGVELTTTRRAGLHRYRFGGETDACVLVDVGAAVQCGELESASPNEGIAHSIGGFIERVTDTELVGRGDYRGGWGHDFPYSIYFYARFDRSFTGSVMAGSDVRGSGFEACGRDCRAALGFGRVPDLNVVVGISRVSVAKARASVEREVGGRAFDDIRSEARDVWSRTLSAIRVDGGTDDQRTLFYTLFTRLMCMPTDLGIDDEFPAWHSGVRHFDDFYCLWDSVRNANSFLSLFRPDLERDFLNCLLDVGAHTGWIPDAWTAGHSAFIQGGCSSDVLLCEAALKGIEGIDYEQALAAMRRNGEVRSPNPYLHGRYPDYHDRDYLSTDVRNCVSRHIEYAYQDWCIGTLARRIGQPAVADDYLNRSRRLWNLWCEDVRAFMPRRPDGVNVRDFDPWRVTRWDAWNCPYFYEGTAHDWALNAHHDFPGLVRRHGGTGAFVDHLDRYFDTEGQWIWKEIVLHTPYLYLYAGRPDKTADRVASLLRDHYQVARNGLRDNEDMGCQSAFFMCSALGLYPQMGQNIYYLAPPVFTRSEIDLGGSGKTLIIECPRASEGRYVSAAWLDNQPLNRAWLRHAEIADGAVLRFELSESPSDWGTRDVPPSPLQTWPA